MTHITENQGPMVRVTLALAHRFSSFLRIPGACIYWMCPRHPIQ